MAAYVLNDIIEDTEVVNDAYGMLSAQRQAIIIDIDVTVERDPTLLSRAASIAGAPQYGDPHPGDPTAKCRVRRIVLRGLANNQARAVFVYERDGNVTTGGGSAGVFTIRDSTSLMSVTTQLDRDFRPIRVSVESPNAESDSGYDIIDKTASISVMVPIRRLIVEGVIAGRPSINIEQAIGCVNDRAWQGKPIGYWLFSDFDTSIQTVNPQNLPGSNYFVRAEFTSKVHENWSNYAVFIGPTGEYARIPPETSAAFRNADYEYGVNWAGGSDREGITRVGYYPLRNFQALFGI